MGISASFCFKSYIFEEKLELFKKGCVEILFGTRKGATFLFVLDLFHFFLGESFFMKVILG